MNAALFPLVYYLRVLVVVDVISLAAHYPIDEELPQFTGFAAESMESKFSGSAVT